MNISAAPHPNILLVDDNPDGLLVRKALLEELGYCVQIASTGEEGLKLFEGTNFDVVVTDYRMPGMNGVELIGRIRTLNADARVILLSGFVDPLGLTESNTAADIVLAKSSNEAAHLVRWVRRLLNRATPRKPPSTSDGAAAPVRATGR
ncbi:MAG TPA: response regulator [Bryobacteraceae bacterium]|jgi:CheY-like chemotaxis protein|nr:response regulator [Bryobacteraceae bacterium]